jgi:hypothetical protein
MKFVYVALLLVVFHLAAISQESSTSVIQKQEKIDHYVLNAPLFPKDSSLNTAKALGVLQHEDIKKAPSQHIVGEVVEYRTLVFDGLELYGRIKQGTEFLPIRITITRYTWKLRDGLDVGAASDHIQEILGVPT